MGKGLNPWRVSRSKMVFGTIFVIVVAVVAVGSVVQPPVVESQFRYNLQLSINGLNVNGWTVDRCPTTTANGTGPWVCSIITNGVIENNTLRFFTGQIVQVNLWFEYLKNPADPTTITLLSVTPGSGFQLVKVEGTVPFAMSGWGSQAGLVLYLKVLPGQHSGSMDAGVRFAAGVAVTA